jgi:hypothetical protein
MRQLSTSFANVVCKSTVHNWRETSVISDDIVNDLVQMITPVLKEEVQHAYRCGLNEGLKAGTDNKRGTVSGDPIDGLFLGWNDLGRHDMRIFRERLLTDVRKIIDGSLSRFNVFTPADSAASERKETR